MARSEPPQGPLITLTSDFGWRDGYVAAIKGVILARCPGATLIDVSHDLPAQDVAHAAFVLDASCPYFPPDTVHVAVVDPGVGTERGALLLTTPRGAYLAPDNGLLTYVLRRFGGGRESHAAGFLEPVRLPVPEGCHAFVLDKRRYWESPVSATFHGRDVFAPVAAHLFRGAAPEDMGTPTDDVLYLAVPEPDAGDAAVSGRVIYADRFGNLVTNIRLDSATTGSIEIKLEGYTVRGLSTSYAGTPGLLAVVGSHGYLEIAVRDGSAARETGAGVGSDVTVLRG